MIRIELKKEPWTGRAGSKQWRSQCPMSVRSAAAGTSGGSVPSRLFPPGSDTWTSFLSFFTPYQGPFDPVGFYFSFESEAAAGLAASVDFESVSDFFSADPCGISSEAEDS